MEHDFWHERWENNQIGFHEAKPNNLLVAHFSSLGLSAGATVFVPLCGKAVDLDWLAQQGLNVVGAELSESAVEEVFERNELAPKITRSGEHTLYEAGKFKIFVGDFFQLTAEQLGKIDAVYDRASLVAMPDGMREDYAEHLVLIAGRAKQLLINFEYDQSQRQGPPFSVPEATIRELYTRQYSMELLEGVEVTGHLAKKTKVREEVWLLSAR